VSLLALLDLQSNSLFLVFVFFQFSLFQLKTIKLFKMASSSANKNIVVVNDKVTSFTQYSGESLM
jgi:hypothetical protein